MWDLSWDSCSILQVRPFSLAVPSGTYVFHSTECRHLFCAMCLLTWWESNQETSCPICRKVANIPPVRDPVQGFVAFARAEAGEEEEEDPFDMDLFDDLFPPTWSGAGRSRRSAIELF